jgi:hypothetical protein
MQQSAALLHVRHVANLKTSTELIPSPFSKSTSDFIGFLDNNTSSTHHVSASPEQDPFIRIAFSLDG